MQQLIQEMLWGMVENFYMAFRLFHLQCHEYEQQIQQLCDLKNVSRDKLIELLSEEEVIKLLDYYEQFKLLRDDYLEPLQRFSHRFAQNTLHKNLLDHYIHDIFYEGSLLKDECYKLKVIAPHYRDMRDEEEYMAILKEVYTFFPIKMLHLFHLFRKARKELENLLVHYRESPILVRSLYLFGEKILAPAYAEGLNAFWKTIYPEYNILELYIRAAQSFYESGFYEPAMQSALKAKELLSTQESPCPDSWHNNLREILAK